MEKMAITKTKLYQLASRYSIYPLPILKKTEIRHYKHTYWLDFCSLRKDDLSCIKKDVTVTFGAEKILWIRCNREGYDQTFQISDQELIELGIMDMNFLHMTQPKT